MLHGSDYRNRSSQGPLTGKATSKRLRMVQAVSISLLRDGATRNMFGKRMFPVVALALLGGAFAAAARADELLEPIAQEDLYIDDQPAPEAQPQPSRVRARNASQQTQ